MDIIADYTVKRAHEDHICDYCGQTIHRGSSYQYQFIVYDYAYSWRAHYKCRDLAHEYADEAYLPDGIPPMYDWEPEYLSPTSQVVFRELMEQGK